MLVLDDSIVNIALPSIQRELGVDEIALLVGHAGGSTVTERIYRKQLRPVIQTGATAMSC
jgi:hypothetical protein